MHDTPQRSPQRRQSVAHLLVLRKRGRITEVLLQRRAADASLMAGMLELPELPLAAVEELEPTLQVKHSITNTNFAVQIYEDRSLLAELAAAKQKLQWVQVKKLHELPLTGLARKVLQRLQVMPKSR